MYNQSITTTPQTEITVDYRPLKQRDIKEQVTYNLINIVKLARQNHYNGSQYNIKNLLILPSINMLDLRVMEKLRMVGKRTNIVAVEKKAWIASNIRTTLRNRGYKNVTVICDDLNKITKERFRGCAPNGFDFAYLDSCSEPTKENRLWLRDQLVPSLADRYFLASNWCAADRSNSTIGVFHDHHPAAMWSTNIAAGRYANALSISVGEPVYDMLTYKEKGHGVPMNLYLQTNYSDSCKFSFDFDLRNIGYKDQKMINYCLIDSFIKEKEKELTL
jgi:hypothetical protein